MATSTSRRPDRTQDGRACRRRRGVSRPVDRKGSSPPRRSRKCPPVRARPTAQRITRRASRPGGGYVSRHLRTRPSRWSAKGRPSRSPSASDFQCAPSSSGYSAPLQRHARQGTRVLAMNNPTSDVEQLREELCRSYARTWMRTRTHLWQNTRDLFNWHSASSKSAAAGLGAGLPSTGPAGPVLEPKSILPSTWKSWIELGEHSGGDGDGAGYPAEGAGPTLGKMVLDLLWRNRPVRADAATQPDRPHAAGAGFRPTPFIFGKAAKRERAPPSGGRRGKKIMKNPL